MMNPLHAFEAMTERQKLFVGLGLVLTGYLVYKWQESSTSGTLKLGDKLPVTFGKGDWLPSVTTHPALKKVPANVQAQMNEDYAARQAEVYRSQMESLGGAGSMPVTSGVWGI